jgi:glycosyltransferase involved in cell wall biosynthesis
MDKAFKISVVIPTYQRCESLRRLLTALANQTMPAGDYEVIVAIDGSQDATKEMVAGFAAPYALQGIWQPNRGRAAACNSGLKAARGELLVLLDDDMEPVPALLEAHWKAHLNPACLGIMGAVPIRFERTSPPVVRFIGAKFNRHLEQLGRPDHQLKLRDFYSGNFSIRRAVLTTLNGFDEDFEIYGNEDLELSLRLKNSGVTLKFSPEALSYQHYTKNFAGLARDNIAKGQTAVLLATKHPETYKDLKLSAYRQASRKWRILRAGLLWLSRLSAKTPEGVIKFMTWLERRQPARVELYYTLVLDYCFWWGVTKALGKSRSLKNLLEAPESLEL